MPRVSLGEHAGLYDVATGAHGRISEVGEKLRSPD